MPLASVSTLPLALSPVLAGAAIAALAKASAAMAATETRIFFMVSSR